MCTAVLIGWDHATPPTLCNRAHITRALLVSKYRRNLFVTPWYVCTCSQCMYFVVHRRGPAQTKRSARDVEQMENLASGVAASRMQIVPAWPLVACEFPSILYMLLAIGGHSGTIATGRQSHSKFACASGKLHAKPPVFCKHAARTIIWIKKWRCHLKSENLRDTCAC